MLAFNFKKKHEELSSAPLLRSCVLYIKIFSFIVRNENMFSLLINERELL